MKPQRVLLCCPNGAGISLMMESMFRGIAAGLELPIARLHHGSIREGVRTGGAYDLILCPRELAPQLNRYQGQVRILPLSNPLSRREMTEALTAFCREERASL